MYDLESVVPDLTVDRGTNVLVAGPPLAGKRQVAYGILTSGAARGDGSVIVATKDGAKKVLSNFDDVPDEVPVGVVDCVTKQRGLGTIDDDPRVKYASSPVDMTGIGINLSEFLQEFYEGRGVIENRVLMDSVSTLLMYSNLQTVFRFLHVFTGRIQGADALGIYTLDSTAHDTQEMNTLKQLFDGYIEVEPGEDDAPQVRTAGLSS